MTDTICLRIISIFRNEMSVDGVDENGQLEQVEDNVPRAE